MEGEEKKNEKQEFFFFILKKGMNTKLFYSTSFFLFFVFLILFIFFFLLLLADPWEKWATLRSANFDSTINVYEESVRAKVKRVVFASTNHTQHALSAKGPNEYVAPLPVFFFNLLLMYY